MSYLLKPLKVGSLELSNRLVMPPMATSKSDSKGKISQEIIDFYVEKSKGGYISLIIVEHSFISQEGKASDNQMSVAEDCMVDGLKELSEVIQKNGSKAVMQINHAGSSADEKVTGKTIVGPSPIINPRKETVPKELTKDEIATIVQDFKNAARRVKEAGFDGVEIHSAHGYLLNQFLSPLTNKRTDEYGGDIHNRIRIHLEVITAIKQVVGDDFTILLRLGASDYTEGGTSIEDSQVAAVEFEKAGVEILDISGGLCGYNANGETGQGYFYPLTVAMKKVVSIPVILTGGIKKADIAEELLSDNKADLIGVGRAILNNSKWAKKAINSLK